MTRKKNARQLGACLGDSREVLEEQRGHLDAGRAMAAVVAGTYPVLHLIEVVPPLVARGLDTI